MTSTNSGRRALKKPRGAMWHFAADDRKLGYGDNRPIVVGETLTVPGPVELCKRGLHASKRVIDALSYAPGAYVCLVTLGGQVVHGDDKSAATERTVIAAADATNLLFQFSIDCAARAMERVNWTHEDSWNALAIRAAHMQGLADEDDLSAALYAAWSAAESAARSAAGYAAEYAAWSAAESAAGSAALYAAWSAAEYAARSAALYAAEYAAWSAAGSAALYAAWSAAEYAARSAAGYAEKQIQNAELERRLLILLGGES